MDTEPKDVIVLGSIRRGKKKFSNIQNETRINSEELNSILEQLENNGFVRVLGKVGDPQGYFQDPAGLLIEIIGDRLLAYLEDFYQRSCG